MTRRFPIRQDPSKLDEKMFKGRAMTYYGRWTYKYEIAAEKGAAAALIVHETGPAGYPYFVLISPATPARTSIWQSADRRREAACRCRAWLTLSKTRRNLSVNREALDYDELKQSAIRKEFKPVPLKTKRIEIKNKSFARLPRRTSSRNSRDRTQS